MSSKGVKFSSLWGGLYQLATKCAVLLANTFTQTDSDLFSNSVIGIFLKSDPLDPRGTQLLIVIIDATWNVNACYYELSYASARSLRMRRSTSSALGP